MQKTAIVDGRAGPGAWFVIRNLAELMVVVAAFGAAVAVVCFLLGFLLHVPVQLMHWLA